jgi:hypothetical protein
VTLLSPLFAARAAPLLLRMLPPVDLSTIRLTNGVRDNERNIRRPLRPCVSMAWLRDRGLHWNGTIWGGEARCLGRCLLSTVFWCCS